MLILSLLDLRQNQNLETETILICIVVQCFPHEMLFEFTRVMYARDQTCQTFVASSGPFGDSSCKLVHRP